MILNLTNLPFPKARIDQVDAVGGLCVFSFLDANDKQVDSGGSVARFTPPTPPDEVTEGMLLAAITAALAPTPVPVPAEVSPWQMRRALNAANLRATVEAAVAAADQDTRDGWEYATTIKRDNAMITAMAAGLDFSTQQVDDLFILAASYSQ